MTPPAEGPQNIFDDGAFFEGYKKLRRNPFSANTILEKPALRSLLPRLEGKRVLDLGCGAGDDCGEYLRRGAARVTGVDISENMLSAARAEHPDAEFLRGDLDDLSFLAGPYDAAFSSLAVHYLRDFPGFCESVSRLLVPGGTFVFSQEHPLTTAPLAGAGWTRDEDGTALHYNLSDYARSGKRVMTWLVDGVVKYHRTFSELVNALTGAGFVIERMLEPVPSEADLQRDPRLARDFHKPDFLLIRARKE